jgi:hypothetical protein
MNSEAGRFKVIGTSNYNLERVSDIVHTEHLEESEARAIARKLNEDSPDTSTYYFEAVPQDQALHVWEP